MTSVVLPQISLSWCYYGELKLFCISGFGEIVLFPPLYLNKVHLSVEMRILIDFSSVFFLPKGPRWSTNTLLQKLSNFFLSCWQDYPVVLTKFIEDAREVEMDAVAKAGRVSTLLFFNIKLVFSGSEICRNV